MRSRPFLHFALTVVIILVSALYMWNALGSSLNIVAQNATSIPYGNLAGSLFLITFSMTLSSVLHGHLVKSLQADASIIQVSAAYAAGQIIRYIPGKIFGLLFEVHALGGKVPAAIVALAHLLHMLFAYGWATAIAIILMLTGFIDAIYCVLLWIAGALATFGLYRTRATTAALRAIPYVRKFLSAQDSGLSQENAPVRLTLLTVANWLPFVAAWIVMLSTRHDPSTAAAFAACYLLAAVISSFAIVVPSGIVVREALFVWLGGLVQLQPNELLAYGLLVRAIMTAADCLNFGFCGSMFLLIRNRPARVLGSS